MEQTNKAKEENLQKVGVGQELKDWRSELFFILKEHHFPYRPLEKKPLTHSWIHHSEKSMNYLE